MFREMGFSIISTLFASAIVSALILAVMEISQNSTRAMAIQTAKAEFISNISPHVENQMLKNFIESGTCEGLFESEGIDPNNFPLEFEFDLNSFSLANGQTITQWNEDAPDYQVKSARLEAQSVTQANLIFNLSTQLEGALNLPERHYNFVFPLEIYTDAGGNLVCNKVGDSGGNAPSYPNISSRAKGQITVQSQSNGDFTFLNTQNDLEPGTYMITGTVDFKNFPGYFSSTCYSNPGYWQFELLVYEGDAITTKVLKNSNNANSNSFFYSSLFEVKEEEEGNEDERRTGINIIARNTLSGLPVYLATPFMLCYISAKFDYYKIGQ
jgi:type II secretory pathway pseudopilin PulG